MSNQEPEPTTQIPFDSTLPAEGLLPHALSPLQTQRVLLPDRQSVRTKALSFVKRIDRIQVRGTTKHHGVTYYGVQIFFKKPLSNIPTVQQHQQQHQRVQLVPEIPPMYPGAATPDVTLDQRFSAFLNLRHEMYFHANTGHVSTPSCGFCSSMRQLLYDGPTLPRLHLKLLHGDATICHALEGFLNSVVELTSTIPTTPNGCGCDGQQEIPNMLLQFLCDDVESKQPPHQQQQQPVRNSTTHKAKRSSFWSMA